MAAGEGCSECVPIEWGSPRFRDRSVGPFDVTDVWFPAGAVLDSHWHDRPVVALTLKGTIESRLAGRALLGRKDDLWTEPVGEVHSNTVGPGGARVLVIQPDPSEDRILEACGHLLDGIHHFRSGAVTHMARSVLPTLGEGSELDDLMIEGIVLQVLSSGARRLLPTARPESRLDRAIELIHDSFLERLTVSVVAERVGLDPSYLARAFKARTGVTVGARIRALRLEWAAERLRMDEDPIGLIALRARFADQSHLTREFRRHLGQTPLEYRKSFRLQGG